MEYINIANSYKPLPKDILGTDQFQDPSPLSRR